MIYQILYYCCICCVHICMYIYRCRTYLLIITMNNQIEVLFECTLGRVCYAPVGSTIGDSYISQPQDITVFLCVCRQAHMIRSRPVITWASSSACAMYINCVTDVYWILRHLDAYWRHGSSWNRIIYLGYTLRLIVKLEKCIHILFSYAGYYCVLEKR